MTLLSASLKTVIRLKVMNSTCKGKFFVWDEMLFTDEREHRKFLRN